ncbi:MAG: GAF domain-containing protein [Chloroflexi bacterium]|nr:GAF domain-containing protein [Chloroflexota bacterium]
MTNPQATTRPHAFTALREMARTLSAAWDLDSALDLIARKTTEVMHVDSCTIYLLDPDGAMLRLRATTGLAQRALGRATLRVGEGMTGYAVQQNRPVFAAEAKKHPHFKWVNEAEESPFQSLLAVPMTIEAELIGALNVQTLRRHEFSPDEVEALALIGDLAAGTIAKARLYDRQRQQIGELQALAQVSEAVTSPQYLDDILDVVTEMAAQMMDTAVCSLFLLNEAGTHLELRSAKRSPNIYRPRPPIPVGEGGVGRVAQTGRPLYIPDVQTDPRYKAAELARQDGLVSMLAVPLAVRDRVIGVLNCYTTQKRTFSEEKQTLFAALANQTALAIENARLVTNTAVIREMHHRIKNNLQTVAMLMQLQLAEADKLTAREALETNIHRIRSIAAVHEVLSEKGFRLVDVKDVLERIVRETAVSMIDPRQTIDIRVYGEPLLLPSREATALTLAVNELVQNALEHGFKGRTRGQIEVSLGHSPAEFIVVVRDDGRGLPADWQRGLGLEIVETLATEDLHGRLRFRQAESGGAEVSIRLPRQIEESI